MSLKADGLDSGESSAEPPHLANISVSVRALTGTNRLLMTQASTQRLLSSSCLRVMRFYIYRCQRTQTIHTQKKLLSDQKNNSSGRQHSLMIVVPYLDNESPLICVKHNQWGKLFLDQTVFVFLKQHLLGFWLCNNCIYTRKDSTVVLIRVLLFIQSRQMTTNTEPSHAQCFCLLKGQVFPHHCYQVAFSEGGMLCACK